MTDTGRARERGRAMLVAGSVIVASQPLFITSQAVFIAALGVLFIASVIASQNQPRGTRWPILFTAFLAWAGLSIGWSADARGTIMAVLILALVATIGLTIARYDPRTIIDGLLLAFTFISIASLALAFAMPSIGRVQVAYAAGAVNGIYSHRNTLGAILTFGVAVAVGALVASHRRKTSLLLTALFGTVVYLTQSGTALIVSVAIIGLAAVLAIFARMSPMARFGILPLATVLTVGFGVPALIDAVPRIALELGRDITFTGRTDIWVIINQYVAESPSGGYGWGGVWGDGSPIGNSIASQFGYASASSAHSGFLDILIQIGFVGLALYLLTFLVALWRAVKLTTIDRIHAWMPLVMATVAVYSFAESRAVRPDGMLLLAIVVGVGLAYHRDAVQSRSRMSRMRRTRASALASRSY